MNILLVDDEEDISVGLRDTVDWHSVGVDKVFVAENGIQALDIINLHPIDIVITDIKMPGMDGIALCKKIYDDFKSIRTIIISGFSNFAFARSALEYCVNNYLLKPVDINELLLSVKTLSTQITLLREDTLKHSIVTHNYYELVEKFFFDIITGNITEHGTILEHLEKCNLSLSASDYRVIHLKIFPLVSTVFKDAYYNDLKNDLGHFIKQCQPKSYVIQSNNEFFIILNAQIDQTAIDTYLAYCEKYISTQYACICYTYISRLFNNLVELRAVLEELRWLQNVSFIKPDLLTYTYDSVLYNSYLNMNAALYKEQLSSLSQLSKSLNMNELDILFNYLSKDALTKQDIFKLIFTLLDLIAQNAIEENIYNAIYIHLSKTKNIIENTQNIFQLHCIIKNLMLYISRLKQECKLDTKATLVYNVKRYIDSNYGLDINMNRISEITNRSSNYLSRIFSEVSGETLIEYLNKVRIEKSKELLIHTDDTLYGIAKNVGYNDERYFIKILKKHIGDTPTTYRNKFPRHEIK